MDGQNADGTDNPNVTPNAVDMVRPKRKADVLDVFEKVAQPVSIDRCDPEFNFHSMLHKFREKIKTSLFVQDKRLRDPDRHETYASDEAEQSLRSGLTDASLYIEYLELIKTSLPAQDTRDPELHETSVSNQDETYFIRRLMKTRLHIKQLEQNLEILSV
jgi:hypothetical protein